MAPALPAKSRPEANGACTPANPSSPKSSSPYGVRSAARAATGSSRSCFDQFLCMAFARLTCRESLRNIGVWLRAQRNRFCHMGIRGGISQYPSQCQQGTRLRIYADFAQAPIRTARQLYADAGFAVGLDNSAYALDAPTPDRCLSLFPWAPSCRPPRRRSNCIRYWTCAATSRRSFTSPTASSTTSISWTC